jgi:hypothetical protein
MTCNFRVGQKVVYAGHSGNLEDLVDSPELVVGQVYTVSNVYTETDDNFAMIELVEHPTDWGNEFWPGYVAAYFRPAADISIFKAMLNPKKEQVKA